MWSKAAATCEAVIKRHPFVDGNKRTGISAGAYLLYSQGYRVEAERGEIESLAVALAAGNLGLEEATRWFEEHSRKAGT